MKWRCRGLGWPGLVMHVVYLVHISLSSELLQMSFKHIPAVVLFTVPQPSVGWVGFLCPCWGSVSLYTLSCDCLLRWYVMQLTSKPCHLPASSKWFKAVFHIFTITVHSNYEENCSEISPCICLSVCNRSKQPLLSAKETGRSAENWKYCRQ